MSYGTWFPSYAQPGQYAAPWLANRPDMMQYPQTQQTAPAQTQGQQQGFITRPVASREEAVAAQVDFFGPGMLMPDFGHNAIYFKRFNQQTGSCDFMTFTLEGAQDPAPTQSTPEYATKADLLEIQQVIQGLAGDIDRLRGGKRIAED